MKIAILSRWNATCGVSLHAELLGRAFYRMGYEVKVFAPTHESANRDWHHKPLDVKDEPWVYRIYSETDDFTYPDGGWLDHETLLTEDYDVLVVEGYQRLPVKKLRRVAGKLKKKTKLVLVVHTGYLRDLEPLMKIPWDAITVFDHRFIDEMIRYFGLEVVKKTVIIPYPHAIIEGVKPYRPEFAKDRILFITYGRQPIVEYLDYLRTLRKLVAEYDLVYWVIRSDEKLPFKEPWIIQWTGRPGIEVIYSYVMGSDIHLLPKSETKAVVVSSTIAQILYSGTPTVVPNTRYFETIPVDKNGFGPVVKYLFGNTIDLYKKLKLLIENDEIRREVSLKAREYALKYSDRVVAEMYVELFEKLLQEEPLEMISVERKGVVLN